METAMLVEPGRQRKRFLLDLLEREGLKVESFDSPEQAMGQIHKVAPDLLIMDVRTPSASGLEVIERFNDLHVPVILLAPHHGTAVRHDLYALGDVVSVPLAEEEFVVRIRGLLKRHRRALGTGGVQKASHPLAAHVLPELHDPQSGRLDARRIAEFLGVALSAFAKFSDMSVAGLHKSSSSASLQGVLIPIARTLTILWPLLGSKEQIRTWMNSPHPDLGGRTPISVVMEGKAKVVSEMLEAALTGQPS